MESFRFEMFITPTHYVIQSLQYMETVQLVVNRSSRSCSTKHSFLNYEEVVRHVGLYLVLGMIELENRMFLAGVTKAAANNSISNHQIYTIEKVELFELSDSYGDLAILGQIQESLSDDCYFSYTFDLTNSIEHSRSKNGSFHKKANLDFYWNYQMYSYFVQNKVDDFWYVPVIKGYLCMFNFEENEIQYLIGLISRRSWRNTNKYGVDSAGNAAGFLETEQILGIHDLYFSYVQARGSVPIYWELTDRLVRISESPELHTVGLTNHILKFTERYKHISFVNLLDNTNKNEMLLCDSWNKSIKSAQQNCLEFDYFYAKGTERTAVNALMMSNPTVFSFFSLDRSSQHKVLWTSYFDCAEKTNKLQSLFAAESLSLQMESIGYYNFKAQTNFLSLKNHFECLWKENFMLLNYKPSSLALRSILNTKRHPKFTMNLRVVTWNLAGRPLASHRDLHRLITGGNHPDIIILSFQEIVKLNPLNVIQENRNKKNFVQIQDLIGNLLPEYRFIAKEDLVGIAILMYAKPKVAISAVSKEKFRSGFSGRFGDKGAVILKFKVFDTSVCVYNCHLANGQKYHEERLNQLREILKDTYKNQAHVKILSGDLNFRIDKPYHEALQMIIDEQIIEMLFYDQLIALQMNLGGFIESKIDFRPTYKFDIGTNQYDTSKKQRVPAWCDRILFQGKLIENIEYGSCHQFLQSDHKPVYADFLLNAQIQDRYFVAPVYSETQNKHPEVDLLELYD